jgi:hypothetical protein
MPELAFHLRLNAEPVAGPPPRLRLCGTGQSSKCPDTMGRRTTHMPDRVIATMYDEGMAW